MIKNIVKSIFSKNIILPFNKGNRFIFIYHDVSNADDAHYSKHYSTTIEKFANHLKFFQRHFELVNLDQIVSKNLDNTINYASVVFDDGFMSVKDNAAPLLRQMNIPFAIFLNKMAIAQNRLWLSDLELGNSEWINTAGNGMKEKGKDQILESLKNNAAFNNTIRNNVTGITSGKKIYLNEEDVIELHRTGVIMGSHTVNHPVLSMCSKDVQLYEIYDNKTYLDKLLQQNTTHFAFPFGKKEHFDNVTIEILKTSGHQFFYTSNPTAFKEEKVNSQLIPRIGIGDDSEQQLMFYINRAITRKIDL